MAWYGWVLLVLCLLFGAALVWVLVQMGHMFDNI